MGAINFFNGLHQALINSGLFTRHRFGSFSQVREKCWSKIYVDGEDYFKDLCNELNKARKEVCITDWWITPFFLLKRPDKIENRKNRLDGILQRLGERGVKILILLFRHSFRN